MTTEINTETLIIALICLSVGIVIGAVLTRIFSKPAKQKRHLSDELRENLQTASAYRHEVTEHFVKTSGLIKNLTNSYTELHQYLADSATKLATPETGRQLAEASSVQLELILPETRTGEGPQAPRDYAPGNGTLSEDYGLARTSSANATNSTAGKVVDKDMEATENDPTLKVG